MAISSAQIWSHTSHERDPVATHAHIKDVDDRQIFQRNAKQF